MLPESAIKEFIEVYRKHYGVILTTEDAKIKAQNFLSFFKSISNEITKPNKIINLNQKGGKKYVASSNGHSI